MIEYTERTQELRHSGTKRKDSYQIMVGILSLGVKIINQDFPQKH